MIEVYKRAAGRWAFYEDTKEVVFLYSNTWWFWLSHCIASIHYVSHMHTSC